MNDNSSFIVEVSIEVCNQIGGIHSVISSKAAAMAVSYGEHYLLVGPLLSVNYDGIFRPLPQCEGFIGKTCEKLKNMGVEVQYGHWTIDGCPAVVLLDPYSLRHSIQCYIETYEKKHGLPVCDQQLDLILNFGRLVELFLNELNLQDGLQGRIIAHFHEYLAASAIPELKRNRMDIPVVFTTHATILGRSLAGRDDSFHRNIATYNWRDEALKMSDVESSLIGLERLITHATDIFTTVSDGMVPECKHLLGRVPDIITPNGLLTAFAENMDTQQHIFKDPIKEAVRKHFFDYYKFDLEKTLFFFTSGRNEFNNKGFDLIIKALSGLNRRMMKENIDKHVVMFFITNVPDPSANDQPDEEGEWFEEAGKYSPGILTHNQSRINIKKSQILLNLILEGLYNGKDDRVKVLYHPEFISKDSLFLSTSYNQFIQGCDLGIFPSKYEPWGYTPHETVVRGIPTITSNVSGFGQFVLKEIPDHKERGIWILNRTGSFDGSVDELVDYMFAMVTNERKEKAPLKTSACIKLTAWERLIRYYKEAYELAMAIHS